MSHSSTRILIAVSGFASQDAAPLQMLSDAGVEIVDNPHGRRLSAGELHELLVGIDGVIAGTEPYTADTLGKANRLKVISRVGIGLDSVDLPLCEARGIRVLNTPDAPTEAVAELTVALMLDLLRQITASDRGVRAGDTSRRIGRQLREVTVGLVGAGRIGRTVVKLLRPFGPRIAIFDTCITAATDDTDNTCRCDTLNELLAASDVVSLHVPLNDTTRHMLGARQLAAMREGALLVNTARPDLVDASALLSALESGRLAGYAQDGSAQAKLVDIRGRTNVVLTPHCGSFTASTRAEMETAAVTACLAALASDLA